MRVHVFHVCYLKPYHDDGRVQPPPVPEMIDDEPEFEVQKILNHRVIKKGRHNKVEYPLRFTGYGPEHDMWLTDVTNCDELVQAYWDSKPATARLRASVCVAYRSS